MENCTFILSTYMLLVIHLGTVNVCVGYGLNYLDKVGKCLLKESCVSL